jgi:hypothetical protein
MLVSCLPSLRPYYGLDFEWKVRVAWVGKAQIVNPNYNALVDEDCKTSNAKG